MKNLEKKICAVTGAGNGIGKATAIILAKYGASVFIIDKDFAAAEETCEVIRNDGGICWSIQADIGNLDNLHKIKKVIQEETSSLDVLVNVAASFVFETESTDFDGWEYTMRHSVAAYSVLSTLLIPLMKGRQSSIINMSSISAHIAQPGFGTYSASKAAISSLTRCMAKDFCKYGIRVNAICPGTVWTENNSRYIKQDYGLDRQGADVHPEIGGLHVLNRCADPEEIAEPIAFLASDSSSFITGTELFVDGGYTIV